MELSRELVEEIFDKLIKIDNYNHNCVKDSDCILPVEIDALVRKLIPILKTDAGYFTSYDAQNVCGLCGLSTCRGGCFK
jgi:hypothetical protein